MTNADRIRAVITDEQLADHLHRFFCPPGNRAVNCPGEDDEYCKTCWLGWLREEVKQ